MKVAATVMKSDSVDLVVESSLLGTLSVPESQTYTLPNGLLGLPKAHGFALIPTERESLFWLQSTDFEALTFLLVDPFHFVDDYCVDLGPQQLGQLATEDPSEILILCILTLPRTPEGQATANLQGPLAFHLGCREGRQVILQDSTHGTRHPLDHWPAG